MAHYYMSNVAVLKVQHQTGLRFRDQRSKPTGIENASHSGTHCIGQVSICNFQDFPIHIIWGFDGYNILSDCYAYPVLNSIELDVIKVVQVS